MEFGLLPRYELILGDKKIWTSSRQFEYEGRLAGLAYFDDESGTTSALPYMTSGSQGMFRFYPGFLVDGSGEDEYITWFSKGYSETSLCLPNELQKLLSDSSIEIKKLSSSEEVDKAELILIGCSNKFQSKAEAVLAGGEFSGVKKADEALKIDGITTKQIIQFSLKDLPENLEFKDKMDEPNFSNIINRWDRADRTYKHIWYEQFESRNGKYQFVFCHDPKGNIWVGNIELNNAQLNHWGLKPDWIDAGALTTPAYEYQSQLKTPDGRRYHDSNDYNGQYVNAYNKFLNRIPIIKIYQRVLEKRAIPVGTH